MYGLWCLASFTWNVSRAIIIVASISTSLLFYGQIIFHRIDLPFRLITLVSFGLDYIPHTFVLLRFLTVAFGGCGAGADGESRSVVLNND